jgi:hypothetical protein
MDQTSTGVKQQNSGASGTRVEMKLEVHVIPVSDIERSKQLADELEYVRRLTPCRNPPR